MNNLLFMEYVVIGTEREFNVDMNSVDNIAQGNSKWSFTSKGEFSSRSWKSNLFGFFIFRYYGLINNSLQWFVKVLISPFYGFEIKILKFVLLVECNFWHWTTKIDISKCVSNNGSLSKQKYWYLSSLTYVSLIFLNFCIHIEPLFLRYYSISDGPWRFVGPFIFVLSKK